jgi:DNA-binding NarL/FixJ family response regulator
VTSGDTTEPSILVVDDQDLVAISLTYTLRGMGFDAHRVPVGTDDSAVLDAVAQFPPGVVLLDLDLGPMADGTLRDGADLVAPLRALGWRVLVVTGSTNLDEVARAVGQGASGWVVKGADLDRLVTATAEVASGNDPLPPEERAALVARYRTTYTAQQRAVTAIRKLTPRERLVLDDLASGLSATEIAERHHISLSTVRNQIHAMLGKLEVNSQLAAVALAHRHRRHRSFAGGSSSRSRP